MIIDSLRKLQEKDAAFFTEAFTNAETGQPYEIPADIKRLAVRLCRSYGINGLCDPMYIANVIAVELGRGDGLSNFAADTGEPIAITKRVVVPAERMVVL